MIMMVMMSMLIMVFSLIVVIVLIMVVIIPGKSRNTAAGIDDREIFQLIVG